MKETTPETLADALDRKAIRLRDMLNEGLGLTAKLRQLASDLRAEDAELGTMQDRICDWHTDKQEKIKKLK